MKIKFSNGNTYSLSNLDKGYDTGTKKYQFNIVIDEISSNEEFDEIVGSINTEKTISGIIIEREQGNIDVPTVTLKHAALNIFDTRMEAFLVLECVSETDVTGIDDNIDTDTSTDNVVNVATEE